MSIRIVLAIAALGVAAACTAPVVSEEQYIYIERSDITEEPVFTGKL